MRKEYIKYPFDLPIKISYLNIKNYPIHWHNSMEIIYVLKGSLHIKIDTDSFMLNEKEVEIINTDIQNISDYENAIELLAEEPAKAVEILLRLAGEFEENPLIYYYLGIAFRKLENYHKAIYYLKESVKRESGILEVIVELGLNYACINDFEEAIKFFKKAFEASRDVEICTNIVMCYLNINDLENAKLHLDIAKNLNPDDEIVKQLDTIINKEQ